MATGCENVNGEDGTGGDGCGDKTDAGTNDGRCVTTEGWRRLGGWREIERQDIEKCEGCLVEREQG